METEHELSWHRTGDERGTWVVTCYCGWYYLDLHPETHVAIDMHLSDAVKVSTDGLAYSDKPWTNGRATVGKRMEVGPVPTRTSRVSRRYPGIFWGTRIGYMVMFTCGYWLAWVLY